MGLALDAFAVSVVAGTLKRTRAPRPIFRLSFHFGLFQFLMPVVGWYGGSLVAHLVSTWDHWVALGLVSLVGGRMVRSGLSSESESFGTDPSRGWTMVMLAVATSIDALAVGLSLAMLEVNVWYPAIVIGVVTATLSVLGLLAGQRLGAQFGKRMELLGGVILIVIGLRIVVSHLSNP